MIVFALPVAGQVFEVRGGSSSLFDAHGASVEVHGQNYVGRLGIGSFDEPRLGLFLGFRYLGINWGLGDQPISFVLPTDLFNRSYYFLGRGVSAERKYTTSSLLIFGGATSTNFTTPFLSVARVETPIALVFYERRLSRSVRLFSYNLFSRRQTTIQSLEWRAHENLRLALSGGIGSNQGYWISSLDFERRWILLEASYARTSDHFRRLRVNSPLVAETSRENIRLTLVPRENLRFVFGRQNYLCQLPIATCSKPATVNSFGVSASAGGFYFHGAHFDSTNQAGKFKASSLGMGRRFNHRLEAGVEYLRSEPAATSATHTVIATIRETVTRRLSLSQVVTNAGGRTSVAYGGNFISNILTLGIDYQTLFLPFAGAVQSQFKQVFNVNLRLQLPNDLTLNGTTNVDLLGRVRYTGYANAFFYRQNGTNGGAAHKGSLFKFVVRGRVADQAGQPIYGAALRIDGELVFTDSQGNFIIRRKKARELKLQILLDQFMFPGAYEVISAPRMVKAAPEETSELYEVLIRRIP